MQRVAGFLRAGQSTGRVSCVSGKRWQSIVTPSAAPAPPVELLQVIQQHIRAHGPLPLPRYMALCLQHPTLGYYTRKRESADRGVLGKSGDFITSPEISQVFGELIAIWMISQWQAQGAPPHTRIIELGPGKGTLMEDMLRTFTRIKAFSSTLGAIELVETSDYMRGLQQERLSRATQGRDVQLKWHSALSEVQQTNDTFTMLVAHEFFDALPVHLFERRGEGWREVMVDNSSLSTGLPIRLAVSPGATLASELYTKQPRYQELKNTGTRAEVCPEGYAIASQAGQLIDGSKAGGAGLIIDYGDEKVFGNSFRAFRDHRLVDPLESPGQADLTANVDFGWLKQAVEEYAQSTPTLTQQEFLLSLGLAIRVEQLLKQAPKERHADIKSATDRLIDTLSMGSQYRCLGIVPKNAAKPFPFSQLNSI